MTIVVTAATGQLGRLAVQALLDRGVPAAEILAGGRNLAKMADLETRTQIIDYDRPDTLAAAFAGAEKVLFISGSEVGQRVRQHRNVVEAARAAGVSLIAYTSVAHCDHTTLKLAAEDVPTENLLKASGLPTVLLRHGWYTENYTGQIPEALERGTLFGAAGEGRISAATRADFAAADVAALLSAQGGEVFEMGGDEPFTLAELAAEVTRQSGRTVTYTDLPTEEYRQALSSAGIPAPMDELLADADRGVRDGELEIRTGDLARLLGRPATTLEEAVRPALPPRSGPSRPAAGAAEPPARRPEA